MHAGGWQVGGEKLLDDSQGAIAPDHKHVRLFPLPVVAESAAALCDHSAGGSPQGGGLGSDWAVQMDRKSKAVC